MTKFEEMDAYSMFGALGYELYEINHPDLICFMNEGGDEIIFDKEDKLITAKDCYEGFTNINLLELKAINRMCESLGWLK